MIPDRKAFIRANTRLKPVPHVPEIMLHVAEESVPIWRKTEEELNAMGLPPPYWAFAWAGGQALARYLLDHPEEAADRRVLDFAAGSGLVGIAAMKAGAASALAADIDPFCEAAVALNAEANGVSLSFTSANLLQAPPPEVDLICAGDVCYARPLAETVHAWLEAARDRGTRVLIGDPGRAYLPRERLEALALYEVETTRELEDREVRSTGVFTLVA